jgi:hypothetical protein
MKNSFYEKEEYSLADLEELIRGEIEESSRLEYKSAGALGKGESGSNYFKSLKLLLVKYS